MVKKEAPYHFDKGLLYVIHCEIFLFQFSERGFDPCHRFN